MNFMAIFTTEETEERSGTFTMVVSAPDIEAAAEKFRGKILAIKGGKDEDLDMFDNVRKVYLDTIIRINQMPDEAMVVYYESLSEDGAISISPVDDEQVEAFMYIPDEQVIVSANEDEDESEGPSIVKPFIVFDE